MMRRVGRVHTSATLPSPLPPPPHRAYCLPPFPSVSLILRIPIATAPIYMYVHPNAILLSLDTSLDCRIYRPPLMTETVAGGGRASPPIADHLSAFSPARVHHRRPSCLLHPPHPTELSIHYLLPPCVFLPPDIPTDKWTPPGAIRLIQAAAIRLRGPIQGLRLPRSPPLTPLPSSPPPLPPWPSLPRHTFWTPSNRRATVPRRKPLHRSVRVVCQPPTHSTGSGRP